jgi:AcrR family transcriptional regulator
MEKSKQETNPKNRTADILNAAQQRFGMYGLEKTTMKNIADDLGMTKGSLYYYFPDKEHLYIAVVEKEFNEFLEIFLERTSEMDDPSDMIREYIQIRMQYFRAYLNLSRFRIEGYMGLKKMMRDFWTKSRQDEVKLLSSIFQIGIADGEFIMPDPDQTANLFLDLLKGLRLMVLRDKQVVYLEEVEFNELFEKTGIFTEIFLKGLRAGQDV